MMAAAAKKKPVKSVETQGSAKKTACKTTTKKTARKKRTGGVNSAKAKKSAAQGCKKATAKPKQTRKKAMIGEQKKTAGEAVPKGLIWLGRAEVLEALKKEGLPLSQKNLYKNYGPGAAMPVRRKDSKWHWPELLERVKMNRGSGQVDYDNVNKVSLARQKADLRIKEAKAETEELKLRKQAGELVEKASVVRVLTKAAADLETNRKTLVAELVKETMNALPRNYKKHERNLTNLMERKTRNWIEQLTDVFAKMEV